MSIVAGPFHPGGPAKMRPKQARRRLPRRPWRRPRPSTCPGRGFGWIAATSASVIRSCACLCSALPSRLKGQTISSTPRWRRLVLAMLANNALAPDLT